MLLLEALVLGLIQGLTEFIPISSSGHLVIAQTFLSGASDHLLLEFINIGTTVALLIYFRRRIVTIIKDIFVHRRFRLARNIIITSVPAGAVGYMLAGFIETTPSFFGSAVVVMVTLAVVGIVMIVVEKLPHASAIKDGEQLSSWRALTIGGAQMLALIPGVSRSGSTILAGRFLGLKPAEAAEYSFLASLPIMLGVTVKVLTSNYSYMADNWQVLLIANIAALVSGLIAVGFLMRYLSRHSLSVFGWYRIGLAVVLGVVLLLQ